MNISLKKYLCLGPGGMNCSCCFPPRGSRRKEFRKAKKKMLRDAMKHEEKGNEELNDQT